MNQLNRLTYVSILTGLMVTISACGAKRFSSDMSSTNGAAGDLTPPPGKDGGPQPGDDGGHDPDPDPGHPGDLLTSDACFPMFTTLDKNSPDVLGFIPIATTTTDAQCASLGKLSMSWDAGSSNYAVYRIPSATLKSLVVQLSGNPNPTGLTVAQLSPNQFRQAVVNLGLAPVYTHTGWDDDLW